MLFTFAISNEFDAYAQFLCEGDGIIDATIIADAFVRNLDEKLNAAFPERDKDSITMVRAIESCHFRLGNVNGMDEYVDEMKKTVVFEDDDD